MKPGRPYRPRRPAPLPSGVEDEEDPRPLREVEDPEEGDAESPRLRMVSLDLPREGST